MTENKIRKAKIIDEGCPNSDDPIYKEGWSVNIMPPSKPKSKKPSGNTSSAQKDAPKPL